MSISQKDRTILWSRAAGRCSVGECRIELTENTEAGDAAYTLGQMAHIVGEKTDAARGHSSLTLPERNSYSNIVLLCPRHHRMVDEDEAAYPIERLHLIKDQHELWVRETLSAPDERTAAANEIYAGLLDAAERAFDFDNWDSWTYSAFDVYPSWEKKRIEAIMEFRKVVLRTPWPEQLDEFERATQTLSMAAQRAANSFLEHCDDDPRSDDRLLVVKWYRSEHHEDSDARVEREKQWEAWDDERSRWVRELCRAANWWADVARRDINPRYLVKVGRLTLTSGDLMGTSSKLFDYTSEQKSQLPKELVGIAWEPFLTT